MFVTLEMMRIVFLQRHVNKSKSHLMQYPDTYNEIALFDFNVIQDFLIRLKEAKIELSFSFKHFCCVKNSPVFRAETVRNLSEIGCGFLVKIKSSKFALKSSFT